jgi:hypothetical protein
MLRLLTLDPSAAGQPVFRLRNPLPASPAHPFVIWRRAAEARAAVAPAQPCRRYGISSSRQHCVFAALPKGDEPTAKP